jgi:quercetin dioxygenase-like cupin family protein
VCWVLEGCIRFELPNEMHLLRAGDALQFDAILHHSYEAVEDSSFLIVQIRKDKRF